MDASEDDIIGEVLVLVGPGVDYGFGLFGSDFAVDLVGDISVLAFLVAAVGK